MKRVAVLLSSYNGEKYLSQQLESILSQSYPEVSVYVRDDGSADATPALLAAYARQGRIVFTSGSNIGFLRSFFALLQQAEDADYYAFSDQDDLWLIDKLSQAVEWLDTRDSSLPLCYHGAYENVDEKLAHGTPFLPPPKAFTFSRAMTENLCSGFTMVINRRMRDEMLRFDLDRLDFHDWLCGAIALGFGELRMDGRICALHRRLDASVTRDSAAKGFLWYLRSLKGDSNMKIRNAAYYEAYGDRLTDGNRAVMELFGVCGRKNAWKKALYPHRWRYRLADEAAVRLAMLWGAL